MNVKKTLKIIMLAVAAYLAASGWLSMFRGARKAVVEHYTSQYPQAQKACKRFQSYTPSDLSRDLHGLW